MKKGKKTTAKNPDIAERKQAEEEFNTLFEVTPELICLVGFDGYFKRLNPSWEKTLGYSMKELLSKPFIDFIHADDRDATNAEVAKLAQGDRTLHFENRYRCKDGSYRYFSWAATPVMEDKLIYCVAHDITERRRVEEALREGEEKYSKAFKTSPYAITITRAEDGGFIEINDAFTSIAGYTREEALSNSSVGLKLWANEEDRESVVADLRAGRVVEGREYQFRTKSGKNITGLFSAQIIKLGSGPCILSSINDITERKRVEETLYSSEAFLNGIIEQSPESLWVSDSEGTMIRMNPACRKLFGITDEEVVGKYNLFKDNLIEAQGFMPLVEAVFRNGGIARFTIDYDLPRVEHIKVSGAMHRIIDVVISPIKDLSGKVTNAIIQHKDITERKRAEEKLRESEAKFRDTVKYLDEGYYSCTMEGLVLDHNLAFNRILGIDLNRDMKGAKLPDFWQDPEDRKVYLKEFMATGSITTYPINAKKSNGEKIAVMASSHLVKDEKGKPVRIDGTFMDITERVRAEETLQQSEEKYRNLFENAQIGMYRSKIDGSAFLDVNKKFADILGFSREELLGTEGRIRWADKGDRDIMMKSLKDQGGILTDFETRVLGKHQEIIDVLASIELHLDEGFLTGTMMDITNRKRAEEALRLKNIVFDASIAANSIADMKGTITEANDAFLRVWGYKSKDEVIGKPLPQFINDQKEAIAIVTALNNTGQWEGDYTAKRKDGSTFVAYGLATTVKDEKGTVIGYQSAVMDVTKERIEGAELKKYREHLEEMVKDRTAELEAANKELESFSYSVSHDLRAPLRTIDGFSLALMEDYDGKLDVQGKDYLRRVRAATQHMAQLIDDMLKLSRITRAEINIEKIDLTKMAWFVISELQRSQPERHVEIRIADGIEGMADSRLMRLVLENLLGNAWKFTGKQPEALIEFGWTKKDNATVYFIRDNGAGFDMAYVNKLFAPFQRLHTMDEYPGTGIGLATASRIIHRHGGKAWAEGQTGKGATFYFSF